MDKRVVIKSLKDGDLYYYEDLSSDDRIARFPTKMFKYIYDNMEKLEKEMPSADADRQIECRIELHTLKMMYKDLVDYMDGKKDLPDRI